MTCLCQCVCCQGEGLNVWIDIERMGGSTLTAMAEAVENAAIVLVCMSEKYKQSPNCRLGKCYVGNAALVLVCISEKYKQIPNYGLNKCYSRGHFFQL